jgi:hypothetical protein
MFDRFGADVFSRGRLSAGGFLRPSERVQCSFLFARDRQRQHFFTDFTVNFDSVGEFKKRALFRA